MATPGPKGSRTYPPPFAGYELDLPYDEMFKLSGEPREHYVALHDCLLHLPGDELLRRKQTADLSFLHQGITFTV